MNNGYIWVYLLLALLAAVLLFAGRFLLPQKGYTAENGVLSLKGLQRFDGETVYLTDGWEYYPGQLIISESEEQRETTQFSGFPMRVTDLPEEGKASFRLLLTDIEEDLFVNLSAPGYYGAYRIYLNGALCRDPIERLSPNFFQFVSIRGSGGETQELVLEFDQPVAFGVDRGFILSDTDIQFNTTFSNRIVYLVFVGMLLFAYVILPLLYKFYKDNYLRNFAVAGGIALVAFFVEILWYSGIVGYVEEVIPPEVLFCFSAAVRLLMMISLCYMQVSMWKNGAFRAWKQKFRIAALAVVLLNLAVSLFLPRAVSVLVFRSCALVIGAVTAAVSVKGIKEGGYLLFLPAVGSLSMMAGFLFNDICISATFLARMVLPFCLLISLVCWSLMLAVSQKQQIAVMEKALTAEQATARTQAAFLASQIQPHFLYNTLTTIQELCYTDPVQAADTVVRFSNYLRRNIDFMEYKDKISFAEEMSHIDNYIEIQKARFGEAIRFVKDIQFEQFVLPPLTVQPLIENAVSHGIRRHNRTGTVTLSVRRVERDILILVSDDGEGFDVEAVHSRSLENIRCRIEGAMHGTVLIDSVPGKGTVAALRFPYKEAMICEDHDRG